MFASVQTAPGRRRQWTGHGKGNHAPPSARGDVQPARRYVAIHHDAVAFGDRGRREPAVASKRRKQRSPATRKRVGAAGLAELASVLLSTLGLAATIEWHVRQFQTCTGIPCQLTMDNAGPQLRKTTRLRSSTSTTKR
jgi:hypothetical protein